MMVVREEEGREKPAIITKKSGQGGVFPHCHALLKTESGGRL